MEFTYNASALGAGGIIQRGNETTIIPSLASVALAPTGGEGSAEVTNYNTPNIGFTRAWTFVRGAQIGRSKIFTTQTQVRVTNLRLFDQLFIGSMEATVTSTRGFQGPEDHEFELLATYETVIVNGQLVAPRIDVSVHGLKRYDQLSQLLDAPPPEAIPEGISAAAYRQGLAERFNAATPEKLTELLQQSKPVQGSLIHRVDGDPEAKHHKVFIPGLGTARFGELMIKPGRRRVNLLRIAFGVDERLSFLANPGETVELEDTPGLGGSMTFASVEGNGSPIGP